MNYEEYDKMKNKYLEIMKDMSKEEKIQYLKDCKFMIAMIDTWDSEDKIADRVLFDLLKELGVENE